MNQKQRLLPFDNQTLDEAQQAFLHAILAGPRKNLDGPFLAWVHSPTFGELAQQLGKYCRYETGLPPHLSELAILITAAFWQSQAEWAIHFPIAIQSGLPETVLEKIRMQHASQFDDKEANLIWRFTTELYQYKRVSEATYQDACETFGLPIVVNLVGLLGYYSMVAMTLNVFNMRATGQVTLPFVEPDFLSNI